MNLRKTYFIFPNLFTLANAFCGFFALSLCAGPTTGDNLYQAALAICFGFFFDLFDGRVARLTRTQSALGVELDSLADVVTFGAAPALLVYKWGLTAFGLYGIAIAFLFLAGGALRLARFNVLAQRETGGSGRFFIGLPIPAAAAVIVSLVVVHHRIGGSVDPATGQPSPFVIYSQGAIATLVAVLAYLMVSRVRFRTFKDFRLTKRTLGVIFLAGVVALLVTTQLRASFIFVLLVSAYVALGLAEEIYRYAAEHKRRRRERRRAGRDACEEAEDEAEDAEVLRELRGDDDGGAG